MRLTVSLIAAMIVAAGLLVAWPDRHPAGAQDSGGGEVNEIWMDDLDAARQKAIEQKKPMLVVFR